MGAVSLWLGVGFVDAEDDDFDQDTVFNFGGDGSAVWNMDSGYGLQFELQGRAGFTYDGDDDDDDDDNNLAYVATAVHGYTQGDRNAYGAYGALYGGGQVDENDSAYYLGGALEAASFLANGTLFGQLGGGVLINDGGEGAENHYFGRGGYRWFMNDYTKFEVDGLIGGVTGQGSLGICCGSYEPDGWYANWGAEFEHQYAGTPLAAFIAYRGYFTNEDEESEDSRDDMFEHVIKLGGTLRFGGDLRTVDHYMPFDAADQSQLLFWDEL